MKMPVLAMLLALALLGGCADDTSPAGPRPRDAGGGGTVDASEVDADSELDAGAEDDGGPIDAGTGFDAGRPGPERDGGTADGGGSTCGAGITYAQVQAIFDASCTSGCHSGRNPSGGLDLAAGRSYADLVNVPSGCADRRLLVKPGEPDASLLYQRLTGVGGCGGSRMPLGGPALGADRLATISGWICGGANP